MSVVIIKMIKMPKAKDKKMLQVSISTHTRLAEKVKLKTDTFETIIIRQLDKVDNIPEVLKRIDAILGVARSSCVGNIEETERLKKLRNEIDELFG